MTAARQSAMIHAGTGPTQRGRRAAARQYAAAGAGGVPSIGNRPRRVNALATDSPVDCLGVRESTTLPFPAMTVDQRRM